MFYDKRNSTISPTEGYTIRLSNDIAGLGGTLHYSRNQLRGAKYFAITDDLILSGRARVGHILGLGEDVRLNDRFFLGGESLRGFATAGVGPRDISTQDSLGGEWVYNGSVELTFPLGLPSEFGISGKVFSDVGSTGSVSPSDANVQDTGAVRASVGFGIGWVSPFGRISVDLGFPIAKEDLDETETFRVNFGTRF